ncbi:hypothetical protein D9M72_444650 [compost metagenome]
MEARQDQLLLAGVGVDVAHREDARDIGLELLGVHLDLLALQVQAPFGDRAQLGRQAEEHQQVIHRHAAGHAVGAGHLDLGEHAVLLFIAPDLADHELHFQLLAQFLHLGDRGGRGAEAVAAVNHHHRLGLADQVQRPVQRRITAADDHQVAAMEAARVLDAVEQLLAVELVEALDLQRARLERAHAGSDEDGLGDEAGSERGLDEEAAVFAALNDGDFLAQVEGGLERLDLLEQVVGQFLAGADGHGRDVVDGLVRIEFHALAADHLQGIDDMCLDFEQAQFKDLEQAHRAGTDDQRIDFLRLAACRAAAVDLLGRVGDGIWNAQVHIRPDTFAWAACARYCGKRVGTAFLFCQRCRYCSLSVASFHSSASASGALVLVMEGQLRASSAFRSMNCCWSPGTSSSA